MNVQKETKNVHDFLSIYTNCKDLINNYTNNYFV